MEIYKIYFRTNINTTRAQVAGLLDLRKTNLPGKARKKNSLTTTFKKYNKGLLTIILFLAVQQLLIFWEHSPSAHTHTHLKIQSNEHQYDYCVAFPPSTA